MNAYLSHANKLREIGRPMQDLHLINVIIASLPEQYARARSNWILVPEAERTIRKLTSFLKTEESIIKSYEQPTTDNVFVANNGTHAHVLMCFICLLFYNLNRLRSQIMHLDAATLANTQATSTHAMDMVKKIHSFHPNLLTAYGVKPILTRLLIATAWPRPKRQDEKRLSQNRNTKL